METRNAIHPEHAKHMPTDELRKRFLVTDIMVEGQTTATYTHHDRMILGGIVPLAEKLGFPPADDVASD